MITGKTITLRMFRSEEEVLTVYNDYNSLSERDINDHTEIYHPNRQIAKFRETGFWSDQKGELLITDKEDSIVGSISFEKTSDLTLEIGYRIYRSENRKKGFMSEALPLFSAYLFKTIPHITRLEVRTASDNSKSRKLLERCGYKQEGILRKAYFYRGRITDFVIYSLLREESPNHIFE